MTWNIPLKTQLLYIREEIRNGSKKVQWTLQDKEEIDKLTEKTKNAGTN